ncbi:hypothetical protein [Oceanibium sediminis]|uniref:hypothetical protein n=1 Tax=Oceanibium sediminis TaxID=2026339 RepID=UPI0013009BA9|nr:hypothetical protein [Oceanibium sediminis]
MIDYRLFPLLETLAASNLDWLVKDILAIVEMGDTQIASEGAMYAAQERIRLDQDLRSEQDDQAETAASIPWSGDEQVALAADIVVRRVKESLVMARASIEVVSTLIGEGERADTGYSVEGLALLGDDGESAVSIDRPAIDHAIESFDQLRLAVEEWKSEMLRGA